MKRGILEGVLFSVLILMVAFSSVSFAGGGPGPDTCWAYLPSDVLHANPGDTVYPQVYATCPTTIIVDWDDSNSANDVSVIVSELNVVSSVSIAIPTDIPNDRTYFVDVVSVGFQSESRIIVGNPPAVPLLLTLQMSQVFWENMAAYQNNILTVDYNLVNTGVNDAYGIWLESQATNGVFPTALPMFVEAKLSAGVASIVRMNYHVPQGVTSFFTVNSATAEDVNDHIHTFGSLPPSS